MRTREFVVCERCNAPILGRGVNLVGTLELAAAGSDVKSVKRERVATPGMYHEGCMLTILGHACYQMPTWTIVGGTQTNGSLTTAADSTV